MYADKKEALCIAYLDCNFDFYKPVGQRVTAGKSTVSTDTKSETVTMGFSFHVWYTCWMKNAAMQNWNTTMQAQTMPSQRDSEERMYLMPWMLKCVIFLHFTSN